MNKPTIITRILPTNCEPKIAAIPKSAPMAIKIGTYAKLAPIITGNREPTFPKIGKVELTLQLLKKSMMFESK